MGVRSVHHSRFSTRCGGRPAGTRGARKGDEWGGPSRHGWMQMTHGGARKAQSPYLQYASGLQKQERVCDGISCFSDVTPGITSTKKIRFSSDFVHGSPHPG